MASASLKRLKKAMKALRITRRKKEETIEEPSSQGTDDKKVAAPEKQPTEIVQGPTVTAVEAQTDAQRDAKNEQSDITEMGFHQDPFPTPARDIPGRSGCGAVENFAYSPPAAYAPQEPLSTVSEERASLERGEEHRHQQSGHVHPQQLAGMPIAGGHGPIVPAEMAHHESEISAILRGIGITQESEEPLAGTHVPAQGGEKNLCDTAGHNPDTVATSDEKQTQDTQGQGEVDHTSDRSENADQQDLSSDKNSKAGSAEVDVKADQDERQDNSQD